MNGQRNSQKVHLSLTSQIPSVSRMLLETDNWRDRESSGMEQINILQPPRCTSLQVTLIIPLYAPSPKHTSPSPWLFWIKNPIQLHVPTRGSSRQLSALSRSTACSFQKVGFHMELQQKHLCLPIFFFNFVKGRGLIQIYITEESKGGSGGIK